MLDKYKRKIDYMRISVTDRCNLKCCYCRPETNVKLQHSDILTYEEILQIAEIALESGINKFKITGGEPLLRKNCCEFLHQLKKVTGVEQVTLTTNGVFLEQYLSELIEAKVDGINVSLDTADETIYRQITGQNLLTKVLAGIEQAVAAGIPVKLNCVPLASLAEKELFALLDVAERLKVPVRFIELMPLSCNSSLQGVSAEKLKKVLKLSKKDNVKYGNGPAVYYRADGYSVPVGIIEPLHGKFCSSCNRVRLTSTGFLKTCLYSDAGADLKTALRQNVDKKSLGEVFRKAVYEKPIGHKFESAPAIFQMNEIGG